MNRLAGAALVAALLTTAACKDDPPPPAPSPYTTVYRLFWCIYDNAPCLQEGPFFRTSEECEKEREYRIKILTLGGKFTCMTKPEIVWTPQK